MCTSQFAFTENEAEKGHLSRDSSIGKQQHEHKNPPGGFSAGKPSEKRVKKSKHKGKKQMILFTRTNLSFLQDVPKAVVGVPQNPRYEGPFAAQCAEDAGIWEQYMTQAKVSDEELSKVLNSDLDSLLIFVSHLLSCIRRYGY
jgi:hypothetical protein